LKNFFARYERRFGLRTIDTVEKSLSPFFPRLSPSHHSRFFAVFCQKKMVTQHGIKFAVHLITKHFGKIVAVCNSFFFPLSSSSRTLSPFNSLTLNLSRVQKVCENLFIHGPLTLDQLVRYTDLTKDQVRNSLLVLVQHNCVQAFVSAPQDDGNITYITLLFSLFHSFYYYLHATNMLE